MSGGSNTGSGGGLPLPKPAAEPCVVRGANMGHQLAGGNSSWCPKLESLGHAPASWSSIAPVAACTPASRAV